MTEKHSFRPNPEARSASKGSKCAGYAPHTPTQNRLLAALPPEDYERLLPHLEPVAFPPGWTVHRAGDTEKYLYFLTAGIVSRFYMTQNGASANYAVAGSEGVVGIESFLGGKGGPSQAVVLSAGSAYRLGANALTSEFRHDGPLRRLLLRYTLALIAQAAQIAVCNRHHSVEQQLCRWILSCLDRSPSNELAMTQELIANMLGVRREGVTEAAGNLQEMGIIDYSRGHIAVLNLPQLKAHACECNGVIKREYDRLLCAEDTIGNAGVHGRA